MQGVIGFLLQSQLCFLHNDTICDTNINKNKNKKLKSETILKISTINVLKSIINPDDFLCYFDHANLIA